MIGDITRRENAGYAGRGRIAVDPGLHHDVAVVHVELPIEQSGVRAVSDRDEYAREIDVLRLRVVDRASDADARYARFIAQYLVEYVVPLYVGLSFLGPLEKPVLQDLLGAQRVGARA